MRRFYCPPENISSAKIIITDSQEIRHIRDSLRLRKNDTLIVFDGKGNEYSGVISAVTPSQIYIENLGQLSTTKGQGHMFISIACAIPKNTSFDSLVDKLTQLGVDRIIPMQTKRSVVRLAAQKQESRLERWNKIALTAAKQSNRLKLPGIEAVKEFKELLAEEKDYDLKLIGALSKDTVSLRKIIQERKMQEARIIVLIGPEGDFTPEEVRLAQKQGFIPVSLGELVLRVETAAIAVASYIRLSAA